MRSVVSLLEKFGTTATSTKELLGPLRLNLWEFRARLREEEQC